MIDDIVENIGVLNGDSGMAILFKAGTETGSVRDYITEVFRDWYNTEAAKGRLELIRLSNNKWRGFYWSYAVAIKLLALGKKKKQKVQGTISVKKPLQATANQQIFYITFEFDGVNQMGSELSRYHVNGLIDYFRGKLKLPEKLPVYEYQIKRRPV